MAQAKGTGTGAGSGKSSTTNYIPGAPSYVNTPSKKPVVVINPVITPDPTPYTPAPSYTPSYDPTPSYIPGAPSYVQNQTYTPVVVENKTINTGFITPYNPVSELINVPDVWNSLNYETPTYPGVQTIQNTLVSNGFNANNLGKLGLPQANITFTPVYVTATPSAKVNVTQNLFPALVCNGVDDEIGVVNNSYISFKNKAHKDGTICIVDADGNVVVSEDDDDISEDYRQQLQEVKKQFIDARTEYLAAKEFQELGYAGGQMATHNNNTYSFFDVIIDMFSVAGANEVNYYNQMAYGDRAVKVNNNVDEFTKRAIDWAYGTAIAKSFRETDDVVSKVNMYKNGTSEQQDAIRDDILHNPEYSDRERAYLAYSVISGDLNKDGLRFDELPEIWSDGEGNFLTNVVESSQAVLGSSFTNAILMDFLPGLGDALDVMTGQGLVKAIIDWALDSRNIDAFDDTSDRKLSHWYDYVGAGLEASWVNEGRAKYNFDTGHVALDFVLEFATDPGNIANGLNAITNIVQSKQLTKQILNAGGYVGDATGKQIRRFVRGNIDADELMKYVSRGTTAAQLDNVRHILNSVNDYSVAYKVSKSLKTIAELNDEITKSTTQLLTMSPLWAPVVKASFSATTGALMQGLESINANIIPKVKAMLDAIAEVCASGTKEPQLSVDNVQELMDMVNRNIAGMKASGEVLDFLTDEDKLLYISTAYKFEVQDLDAAKLAGDITEADYVASLNSLKKDTYDVLQKNKLNHTPFAYVLNGTSQPRYAILPHSAKQWAIDSDNVVKSFIADDTVNAKIKATLGDRQTGLGDMQMSDCMDSLYVAKINERTLTESILSDHVIAGMVGLANKGEWGPALQREMTIGAVVSGIETKASRLTKEFDGLNVATKNYDIIKHGIESSRVIPESLKPVMVDRMFAPAFKKYTATTFAAGIDNINPSQVTSRAYNMARRLVNDSLGLNTAFNRLNKYIDLGCNTLNAVDNVHNMIGLLDDSVATKIKEVYGINVHDSDIVNICYSFEKNELDDLTKMVFNNGTDIHLEFDLTTPEGIAAMDKELLRIRSELSHAGQHVQFYGFNCKASTFDSDDLINRWLSSHRSQTQNIIRGSIDIADVKRAIDFDVPIIRDEVYEDAAKYFEESINNWLVDSVTRDAIGMHKPFSITGVSLDDLKRIKDVADDNTYVGMVTDPEQSYIDRITKAVNDKIDELSEAHSKLTNNVGVRRYTDTLMENLKKLGPDVGASKVYEYSTINKFYDITNMTVAEGMAVYDTASQLESILNGISDHRLLDLFSDDIEEAYKYTIDNVQYVNTPELIKGGVTDEAGHFLLKCDDIYKKTAAMQFVYNNTKWGDGNITIGKLKRPAFFDALATPYTTYCTPTRKYYTPYETMKGAIDNKYSEWNILDEVYKKSLEIDEHIADQKFVAEFRKMNGMDGELDVVRAKYMNEMHKPYNDIINHIKDRAEEVSRLNPPANSVGNKYEWAVVSDIKHSGRYDGFGKSMYTYDVAQAKNSIAYIEALDDNQFINYMRQCNGRLVVDGNYLDKAVFNDIVKNITERNIKGLNISNEDNIFRAWSPDLQPTRRQLVSPSVKPMDSSTLVKVTAGFEQPDELLMINRFKNQLSKHNDASFTYGLPVSNERGTREFVVNKYFSDVKDQFNLERESTLGDYYCGYIGSVKGMLGEGSFVSGDYFSNLVNSYSRTIRKMDNMSVLKDCILKCNEVVLHAGDDIKSIKNFMAQMEEEGCVIVGYNNLEGNFKVMNSPNAVKVTDKCTVMRADEAAALISHSVENIEPNKLMRALGGVRYLESKFWLQFQLFTSPGTWAKNWVDSTVKGWLTQGDGYSSYLAESLEIQKNIGPAMEYLEKRFPDGITGNAIDRLVSTGEWAELCKKYGFTISGDRLKLLYQFGNSTLTDWKFGTSMKGDNIFKSWIDDTVNAAKRGNIIDTIASASLTPFHRFNSNMFQGAEMTNRLAIFLKQMDETHGNTAKAYKSIAESQFDYAMTGSTKLLNTVLPYSSFKLKNYKFWLSDVWQHEGVYSKMRQIARLYDYGPDEYYEKYWSADMIRLRTWIDTCNFEDSSDYGVVTDYNQFKDFQGSKLDTAKEYGWIRFSDKLYYKLGLSWMDATNGFEGFIQPSGILEGMWTPLSVIYDLITGKENKSIEGLKAIINGDVDLFKLEDLEHWYNEYGFETTALLPIIGTLAYTIATGTRNGMWWERLMEDGTVTDSFKDILQFVGSTLLPSLFAPKRQFEDKEYYIDRPIGFDWYNQDAAYKSTHKYVPFVSYMPTWVTKDPATYINTLGRFKQLLGDQWSNEDIFKLMEAGLFWGWKDGEVVLKSWLDDDVAFENLINKLQKFGWSRQDAMDLIASTSKYWKLKIEYGDEWYKHWNPTSKFVKYTDEQWEGIWNHVWKECKTKDEAWAYLRGLGFKDAKIAQWLQKWGKSNSYSRRQYTPRQYTKRQYKKWDNGNFTGYNKYKNVGNFFYKNGAYHINDFGWNQHDRHPKMFTLSSRLAGGKNVMYGTYRDGHSNEHTRTFQIAHRWHHRQRDIYRDNYAKYGASRMRMNQNPRMYTNRSITEMYRTNQNLRYSQIHRHTRWY